MADRRTRGWVALLALLALIVGAAACGDDDDDDTGSPAEDTEAAAAGPSEEDEAFCGAVLGVAGLRGPDEETPEALEAYANEVAQPAVAAVVETAPDEAADDAQGLSDAFDEVLESGDSSGFEAAVVPLTDRAAELCDWSSADVEAVDYGFEGLESSYDAGALQVAFTNGGEEMHEFLVLRKKDGVEESFEELFQLPDEEGQQKVDMVGATFAPPGDDAATVLELTPGDYAAVCFVPVGSTPEAVEAAESGGTDIDGPPHFTEGMVAEFSVS